MCTEEDRWRVKECNLNKKEEVCVNNEEEEGEGMKNEFEKDGNVREYDNETK